MACKEPVFALDGSLIPCKQPVLGLDGSFMACKEPVFALDGSPIPFKEPVLALDGSPIPFKGRVLALDAPGWPAHPGALHAWLSASLARSRTTAVSRPPAIMGSAAHVARRALP